MAWFSCHDKILSKKSARNGSTQDCIFAALAQPPWVVLIGCITLSGVMKACSGWFPCASVAASSQSRSIFLQKNLILRRLTRLRRCVALARCYSVLQCSHICNKISADTRGRVWLTAWLSVAWSTFFIECKTWDLFVLGEHGNGPQIKWLKVCGLYTINTDPHNFVMPSQQVFGHFIYCEADTARTWVEKGCVKTLSHSSSVSGPMKIHSDVSPSPSLLWHLRLHGTKISIHATCALRRAVNVSRRCSASKLPDNLSAAASSRFLVFIPSDLRIEWPRRGSVRFFGTNHCSFRNIRAVPCRICIYVSMVATLLNTSFGSLPYDLQVVM